MSSLVVKRLVPTIGLTLGAIESNRALYNHGKTANERIAIQLRHASPETTELAIETRGLRPCRHLHRFLLRPIASFTAADCGGSVSLAFSHSLRRHMGSNCGLQIRYIVLLF